MISMYAFTLWESSNDDEIDSNEQYLIYLQLHFFQETNYKNK